MIHQTSVVTNDLTYTEKLEIINCVWSPQQVTHLPPVWDILLPLGDTSNREGPTPFYWLLWKTLPTLGIRIGIRELLPKFWSDSTRIRTQDPYNHWFTAVMYLIQTCKLLTGTANVNHGIFKSQYNESQRSQFKLCKSQCHNLYKYRRRFFGRRSMYVWKSLSEFKVSGPSLK